MSLLFALSSSLAGGQHEQQRYRAQLYVTLLVSCLTCCRWGLMSHPPLLPALPLREPSCPSLAPRECKAQGAGAESSLSPSVGGWISLAIAWNFTLGTPGAAQQACYMQIRQKSRLIVHEIKMDPQVEVAGSGSQASLTGALSLHPNANAISTASSSTITPLMWLSDLFR